MMKALSPKKHWDGAEWSSDELKRLMKAIAVSKYGCIRYPDAVDMLGESILESIIKENVASIRTYNPISSDIPTEAFGPDGVIVTTDSFAELAVIRKLCKEGKLEISPKWYELKYWF